MRAFFEGNPLLFHQLFHSLFAGGINSGITWGIKGDGTGINGAQVFLVLPQPAQGKTDGDNRGQLLPLKSPSHKTIYRGIIKMWKLGGDVENEYN